MRSGQKSSTTSRQIPETISLIDRNSRVFQDIPISIRRRQGLPPAAFIAQMQIFISITQLILGIGFLILFTLKIKWNAKNEGPYYDKQLFQGGILYSSQVVVLSCMDLILGFLLRTGAKRMNSEYCLFWYRATVMSTVIFFLETLAFFALLKSGLVFFGVISSLVFKPFALFNIGKFTDMVLKRNQNCKCTSKSDSELIRVKQQRGKVSIPARNAISLDSFTAVRHENEVRSQKKTI